MRNPLAGALYSMPSLTERLGVSTTSMREALLVLSRLGLLAPMRNRGFRIVAVRAASTPGLDVGPLWQIAEETARQSSAATSPPLSRRTGNFTAASSACWGTGCGPKR